MNIARYRKSLVLLFAAVVMCLVAGSFADLEIARALYNPSNLFGRLGAAYGQLPAEIVLALCGMVFVRCAGEGVSGVLPAKSLLVIGYVLIVGAVVCDTVRAGLVFDLNIAVRALISAALVLFPARALFQLAESADAKTLFRYALFCIVVLAVQLVLVNVVLKEIWQRPRPYLLVSYSELDFQNWWEIGCPDRKVYISEGVIADAFRSFPSGHTANAACAVLVAALPLVVPGLTNYQDQFFIVAVIVTVLVAVSRMIMGMHFLSDVSMGFAVTTVVTLAGVQLFFG